MGFDDEKHGISVRGLFILGSDNQKRVVHWPKNMSPYDLQLEHIEASRRIYSVKRLIRALLVENWVHKVLFMGEFLWHWSIRHDLKRELKYLPRDIK